MSAFGKVYNNLKGTFNRVSQSAKDFIGKAPGTIRQGLATANDALKSAKSISDKGDRIYGAVRGYLPSSARETGDKIVKTKNTAIESASRVNDIAQRITPRILDIAGE